MTIDEAIAADPKYIEWLKAQSWFRERFEAIYLSIVNVNTGTGATLDQVKAMFRADGIRIVDA